MSDAEAQLTDEESDYLFKNPDVFIEQIRTIKGQDFSLDERPYLRDIYHEFSLIKEKGKKPETKVVVLYCSRKIEKTETIINLLLIPELLLDYFTAIYTAPRSQQISDFSIKRFTEAVATSKNDIIDKRLKRPTSVSHKEFITVEDEKWHNHLWLYSAWGEAASLLGQEGDMVAADEYQDFIPGTLAKIMEIFTLSPYKWLILSGTARDAGDEFDKTFKKSTMNEWEVTCQVCDQKQFLTFERTIQGSPGAYYKGCYKCKTELDIAQGEWIPTHGHPEKAIYVGYHIHQLMHPVITANEIMIKYDAYESERLFYNEVLGLSYSGGSRPISISDIMECTNASLKYKFSDDGPGNVAGMDTGKEHVITVMSTDKVILHQEIIDTTRYKTTQKEEEHIENILNRFNVELFVIDWGYTGQIFIKDLQAKYKDRIRGCRYGTTDETNWMKYEEYETTGKRRKDRIAIYRYNVFRAVAMETVMWSIKKHEITIPYALKGGSRDMAESTFSNYTNVTSDAEEKLEEKEFTKKRSRETHTKYGRSGPDHFFHTLVYCFIALIKKRSKRRLLRSI